MSGVSYLEITWPQESVPVRGAFLSWLEERKVKESVDFPIPESEQIYQPFQSQLAPKGTRDPSAPATPDRYLFGTVFGQLQEEAIRLGPGWQPAFLCNFELEKVPLVALLTFEVEAASLTSPASILVNKQSVGDAAVLWTDLPDPGYQGQAKASEGMDFRYTGWLRAQKMIPASALAAGVNQIEICPLDPAAPIAIRFVEIQLKYNWEKLDYLLTPAQLGK